MITSVFPLLKLPTYWPVVISLSPQPAPPNTYHLHSLKPNFQNQNPTTANILPTDQNILTSKWSSHGAFRLVEILQLHLSPGSLKSKAKKAVHFLNCSNILLGTRAPFYTIVQKRCCEIRLLSCCCLVLSCPIKVSELGKKTCLWCRL